MEREQYALNPVGRVRADGQGFELNIDKRWEACLQGLEGYSHVLVLFWFHNNDNEKARAATTSMKPYARGPESIGVYATRSPYRPNPIGLTPARVLGVDRERGVVRVEYLDAEDGTPILDLKPYLPCSDRVRDVSVPAWCSHWPACYEDNAGFDWGAEFTF